MAFLLHQLLTESARQRPDGVAVRIGCEAMSYAELEARSNQLAHALMEAGVASGDRVGLHLKKSLEAIVAIYGILKTGACYVPVDTTAPAHRLASIVRLCGIRSLITFAAAYQRLAAELPAGSALEHVFLVDRLAAESGDWQRAVHDLTASLTNQPTSRPKRAGTDQDLAYILFTSGSTGEPKGVMLSHLNALTFVNWCYDTFAVTADDRLSNHAPFNFDLSILDIFVAARAGATLCLVPETLALFPIRLADYIQEQAITIWYSVPSVLRLLLQHGRLADHDLSRLRLILFAGEVFPTKYLRELRRLLPTPQYFNLYGPTETNVCTSYEVRSLPDDQTAPIPIGRACANTETVVISETGERVTTPGVAGVLHVRGSTVMQGYYGRPEDTARSFIPNPFAEGREERLYCTGDWVSHDEEGNYLFMGRRDHLIKTRGYRVELGEIETALYAHPDVREAAAVPVPDDLITNRIRAVVVGADADPDERELRSHCARLLPTYMVPSEFEFRRALPRTGNGKVDRSRLASEAVEQVQRKEAHVD